MGSVVSIAKASPDQSDRDKRLRLGQLAVIDMIASGTELDGTLGAICKLIESQEEGLSCCILRLDDLGLHTGGGVGPSLDPAFLSALENICISPPYLGSCCRALDRGEEIDVPDIANDPRWASIWREVNLAYGLRACRSIPVFDHTGRVLASVAVFRGTPGDPGPADRTLLHIATHLAGIAIEKHAADATKKQLQSAAEDASKKTALLLEAASVLLFAPDPEAMVRSVFEKIAPTFELDVFFNYLVVEGAQGQLRLACSGGLAHDVADDIRNLHSAEAVSGAVAAQREEIVHNDLARCDDPRVGLLRSIGLRAYASFPMISDQRLIGTLSFGSRRRDRFEAADIDFLRSICTYATAAYDRLNMIAALKLEAQRKTEFLATLSHELRNPLAPMRTGLELLKVGHGNKEVFDKAKSMMERQLKLLTRLVDDLMDISRIATGRLELRIARFDLHSAIQQAIELSMPLLEQHRHELTFDLPAEPIHAQGDCDRISQVVTNLLNNAARYTPDGGKIRLKLSKTAPGIAAIQVRDSGIGMSPDALALVFSMFTQANPSSTRSKAGMGIGLALAKGLMEMHHGTINAHSDGIGQGATFTLSLPVETQRHPH